MNDSPANRTKEIEDAIRDILFYRWDPISVRSNPGLKNEYDHYIAAIHRLLVSTPTRETIAQELATIEWEFMGLNRREDEALLRVADELLAIDVRPGQ